MHLVQSLCKVQNWYRETDRQTGRLEEHRANTFTKSTCGLNYCFWGSVEPACPRWERDRACVFNEATMNRNILGQKLEMQPDSTVIGCPERSLRPCLRDNHGNCASRLLRNRKPLCWGQHEPARSSSHAFCLNVNQQHSPALTETAAVTIL
jgi:hypothetical protein